MNNSSNNDNPLLSLSYQVKKSNDYLEVCYSKDYYSTKGTLITSLPYLLTQLFIVLFIDRVLLFILKPLHQPRIVAHIICGILLGPSVFGETTFSRRYVMPYPTTTVLETFSNLALLYYMFLVGLELDFSLILHCGTKPLAFALCGTLLPLGIGFGLFFLVLSLSTATDTHHDPRGSLFWAILLTSTNFLDLTRLLADLKLLRSEIGRIAMSSAIISDLCSWLLLVVAISFLNTSSRYYVVISTAVFILTTVFLFRPALSWLILRSSNNNSENVAAFILAGVVLFGLVADACGSHSISGAFMFGVIMPRGIPKSLVIEKIDGFVMEVLIPAFFFTSGLRSDVSFMWRNTHWNIVLMVVVVSCSAKIISALLVSLAYRMSPREGLALGLLMNTKGVLGLIILNTGRNVMALSNQTFPMMVLSLLVMSSLIQPILAYMYKRRDIVNYKNRSIKDVLNATSTRDLDEDVVITEEFRVLMCLHSSRNLSGMLGLVNLSNAAKQSPLCLFSVHLMELSGRADNTTAMLIVHDEFKSSRNKSTETGQIINAFENFKKRNAAGAVTTQTITSVSPYASMHVDICGLAEDKRVALIILPFHLQVKPDGRMGNTNSTLFDVNHNVLMNAPCSVGILIDRSLGGGQSKAQKVEEDSHRIAMLFIGGPDDREALAYAWRMAGQANVKLTVVRFSFGRDSVAMILDEREKLIDDEYLYEFKFKTMQDNSITYVEKMVHNSQELIAETRAMGDEYDLYLVGRGKGLKSPELLDWSDCTDLGVLGDTLGSSNFALDASVLVLQQSTEEGKEDYQF